MKGKCVVVGGAMGGSTVSSRNSISTPSLRGEIQLVSKQRPEMSWLSQAWGSGYKTEGSCTGLED